MAPLDPDTLVPIEVARRLNRELSNPDHVEALGRRDSHALAADRRALAAYVRQHGEDIEPGLESRDTVPWSYRGPSEGCGCAINEVCNDCATRDDARLETWEGER